MLYLTILVVKMKSYGDFELWLSVIFSYGFGLLLELLILM